MTDINKTIEERAKTHGDYAENSRCFCALREVMDNRELVLNESQILGLTMIFSKIARILTGNPDEPDHWHDIAGFAILVERELRKP